MDAAYFVAEATWIQALENPPYTRKSAAAGHPKFLAAKLVCNALRWRGVPGVWLSQFDPHHSPAVVMGVFDKSGRCVRSVWTSPGVEAVTHLKHLAAELATNTTEPAEKLRALLADIEAVMAKGLGKELAA